MYFGIVFRNGYMLFHHSSLLERETPSALFWKNYMGALDSLDGYSYPKKPTN